MLVLLVHLGASLIWKTQEVGVCYLHFLLEMRRYIYGMSGRTDKGYPPPKRVLKTPEDSRLSCISNPPSSSLAQLPLSSLALSCAGKTMVASPLPETDRCEVCAVSCRRCGSCYCYNQRCPISNLLFLYNVYMCMYPVRCYLRPS